jgi:hypothetical protein
MRIFTVYIPYKISLRMIKTEKDEMGGGVWHVWGRRETHTEFWWGNLRERDNFENIGADGRIILK